MKLRETKLWRWVLFPIADMFYPANDCATCYFWRAFLVGVWAVLFAQCVGTARWHAALALVALAGALFACMHIVDSSDEVDKL